MNSFSTNTTFRKAVRMLLILISILLAAVLLLVGVLVALSPGKPIPFKDQEGNELIGSISEKVFVNINGVQQGMFIKSRDATNPVLLFLHGGPGMPEYYLTKTYPTGLEEYFTVAWWDQRGAGLSFSPDIPSDSMTIEQYLLDIESVSRYLRSRFGKEKIFLMAHSGGSFFGIQAAARTPELYHAYIGVSQVTFQLESEQIAYEYMLNQFKEIGDTNMVRQLEVAAPTVNGPLPPSYDRVRDSAMHRLGVGTTKDMRSVITGVFLPSWFHREYTLSEKLNIWRGKSFAGRHLRAEVFSTDLRQYVTRLDLPVYFFHGSDDYTVSGSLASGFFQQIEAPIKGFYTFNQSAHSPLFEEPERMREIMQIDVLKAASSMADGINESARKDSFTVDREAPGG